MQCMLKYYIPADSDDDEGSDAELPDVEEVAGVELGAEEEEEESLKNGGDGLGDAVGEAGGLGAEREEEGVGEEGGRKGVW